MAARRSGRVLITASVAATMSGPYSATYAASKAFDLSFAQSIRHGLKNQGVEDFTGDELDGQPAE